MPEDEEEKTRRAISEHLSRCRACRELLAISRNLDEALAGERHLLDEIALHSRARRRGVLAEKALQPERRAWRWRPAWVGAAVLVLAIAGASAVYFLTRGNGPPPGRPLVSAPKVTRATAGAARSEALHDLAAAMCRHEAPPFEFPYTPPASAPDFLLPRLLQRCALESEETLAMMVESKANLTRRDET